MNSEPQTTVIGPQTLVKGTLAGDGDLTIIGRIEGKIALTETLVVEPSGLVQADIQARKVVISGAVVGNIAATELVQIGEQGRVVGDLKAPRVVLMDGSAFRGTIEMENLGRAAKTSTQRKELAKPRALVGASASERKRATSAPQRKSAALAAGHHAPKTPRPPTAAGKKRRIKRK